VHKSSSAYFVLIRIAEYIQVVQGHAKVTLGDDEFVLGPEDGVVTVAPFTVHQYSRADDTERGAASKDMELWVKEWTDPADGDKEIFFRNVISSMIDRPRGVLGTAKLLLTLFTIMNAHDNYPVIWRGPAVGSPGLRLAVRRAVTKTVLGILGFVGWAAGFKGSYEEYTPKTL
jgi:hypothetical protein